MSMRITTNMVMRNYQNNLSNTMQGLESARRQVETGRRFSHSYEDPSSAARASILERRYMRNADYQNNVKNTQKWQDTQEDVVTQISKMAEEVSEKYSIEAMDVTKGETLDTYAKLLRGIQESMVQSLNTKYGETYVMAGQGGTKAPFSLGADGKLLYRGIDVNDQAAMDAAGYANEASYVDLGFGMAFEADGSTIVSSSAFNAALPGINVVGYGKTADGIPKNLVVLAGEMAEVLETEPFDPDQYEKLWDQFREGSKNVRNTLADIGTKSKMLESTMTRLENEELAINEQFTAAVGIEPAEAITNYSWAMYTYNTALKVGTSIITPSLLDFLK